MRGNQTEAPPKVQIQPPAEPKALRDAAASEVEPARGFTGGAPAQGKDSAPVVEPFAGPDPRDVRAVQELIALALEGTGFLIARGKFLRGIGQGMFDDAADAAAALAEDVAIALEASGVPMNLLRGAKWVAKPIRYGLAKAAPERFAPPPPGAPPRQPMQPGGAETPPAPAMPAPGAPAAPTGLEVVSG